MLAKSPFAYHNLVSLITVAIISTYHLSRPSSHFRDLIHPASSYFTFIMGLWVRRTRLNTQGVS